MLFILIDNKTFTKIAEYESFVMPEIGHRIAFTGSTEYSRDATDYMVKGIAHVVVNRCMNNSMLPIVDAIHVYVTHLCDAARDTPENNSEKNPSDIDFR